MRSFSFHPGPALLSAPGCASNLPQKMPEGPCLFVSDRDVLSFGLAEDCLGAFEASGRPVILFAEVEADPSKQTLLSAVDAGRSGGATHVVGFGGGSPMDVAKLAAYLLGSGDDLDTIWGVGLARGQRLPLALVPTTAGTGSEATPVAVITCEGGEKRGVNSPALVADWAALDAELTVGKPRAARLTTLLSAIRIDDFRKFGIKLARRLTVML
jgi:alcohol dehydrogenase